MGIEKVSLNVAKKLGGRLAKSKEEIAVLNYGLFIIMHTSLVILATLILGLITNTVVEMMTITCCSAILKRYSGGVHASSPMRCLIIGVSMSTILALICRLFTRNLNFTAMLLILVIGIIISYYTIYKRCPIGTKKNPMKNENRRKILRKKSFNTMNIYSVSILSLFFIYLINGNLFAKSLCMSILFGAFIQIFALSKIGERIILGIDNLLDI